MAKLIYSAIASLDGYVEDGQGRFDWAEPDGEVHSFINDLERPVGTYLYGRRMYETMPYWETAPKDASQRPCVRDFTEIWQKAEKIVYSRTLESVSSTRTRIEPSFEPGYSLHTFNLASYAGQTIILKFTGAEDYTKQTSFVIDDATVNVS